MPARIAAFVVWAAVAACLVFWGLRLFVATRAVPPQAQPVSLAGAERGDILRLFAAAPAPGEASPSEPSLAARFKLIGVMAPRNSERGREQGVALIAVDDKPPRAYRVGARIDNSLVLQSVAARSAVIGPPRGAAAVQLDLPLPALPATGTLPPVQADGFLPSRPPLPAPTTSPAPPVSAGQTPLSISRGASDLPQELPQQPLSKRAPPGAAPEDDPVNRR